MNSGGQIARAAVMSFTPSSPNYAYFELLGYSLTLGGINDATGRGVIEHAESEANITANSTLTINATAADSSFNGYLRNGNYGSGSTGTLSLVKDGTYKLTLTGNNCGGYTGGLTVNEGTLDYSGGTLPNCAYTVNGGTLVLGAKNAAITAFRLAGGTVSGTGSLTSTTAFDIESGSVYPALAGGVALNKTGAGTATLCGTTANSYSGGATISNGKLILAKSNNVVAIPGSVTINTTAGSNSYLMLGANGQISSSAVMTFAPSGSAYATFELGGKSQTLAGVNDFTGRGVIENSEMETGLSSNGVLIINGSVSSSFNGFIRNRVSGSTGRLTLLKVGTGTLTLSGLNCGGFSGGLIVSGGTLDYSAGALPGFADGAYCNYTINGGTLNIGAQSQSIGTFRISNPNARVNGTGTLTSNVDYDIQSGTVNAVLAGNVGLNKTGAGDATISGPTYTGATSVSDGALEILGILPHGAYAISGGSLDLGDLSGSIGGFRITAGTVTGLGQLVSNSDYQVEGGVIGISLAGGAGLVKTLEGAAVLEGANTFTGTTRIERGTLGLRAGGRLAGDAAIDNDGTFVIVDGTHVYDTIAGSGSTLVGDSVRVDLASLVQDRLSIGGNYDSLLTAGGSNVLQNTAVPEPSVITLMILAGVLIGLSGSRRRR
jgi:autotransporter-associated beta strand protein